MRVFLMITTVVGFALSTVMLAGQALAVQDTPATINGVETVCTGVGSAKDDPRWAVYPVKIVLVTTGGANLANAHVTLAKGRQILVQTDCDAPWILFKAPSGSYTVTASLIGGSESARSASFSLRGGAPQKEITIMFARPTADMAAATPPAGQ